MNGTQCVLRVTEGVDRCLDSDDELVVPAPSQSREGVFWTKPSKNHHITGDGGRWVGE